MFAKVNDPSNVDRFFPRFADGLRWKLMSDARKFEMLRSRTPGNFLAVVTGLTLALAGVEAGPFSPEGTQYLAAGSPVGDQILPALAFRSTGGWLVWQDNSTDGLGFGISARRLTGQLTGLCSFRVNEDGAGDQENAQVGILPDGGALIVWQSGNECSSRLLAESLSQTENLPGLAPSSPTRGRSTGARSCGKF